MKKYIFLITLLMMVTPLAVIAKKTDLKEVKTIAIVGTSFSKNIKKIYASNNEDAFETGTDIEFNPFAKKAVKVVEIDPDTEQYFNELLDKFITLLKSHNFEIVLPDVFAENEAFGKLKPIKNTKSILKKLLADYYIPSTYKSGHNQSKKKLGKVAKSLNVDAVGVLTFEMTDSNKPEDGEHFHHLGVDIRFGLIDQNGKSIFSSYRVHSIVSDHAYPIKYGNDNYISVHNYNENQLQEVQQKAIAYFNTKLLKTLEK